MFSAQMQLFHTEQYDMKSLVSFMYLFKGFFSVS